MTIRLIIPIVKCIIIIALSVILPLELSLPAMNIAVDLTRNLERAAPLIVLFIVGVLVPVISSVSIIGILGVIWIANRKWIGFVLALFPSMLQLFGIIIKGMVSFKVPDLMLLAGIPAIILSSGFTYKKACQWRENKRQHKSKTNN